MVNVARSGVTNVGKGFKPFRYGEIKCMFVLTKY